MRNIQINSIRDGHERNCICEIAGTKNILDPLCTEFVQKNELTFNGTGIRVRAFISENKKGTVHLFLNEKATLSCVTTFDEMLIIIFELDDTYALEIVVNYS